MRALIGDSSRTATGPHGPERPTAVGQQADHTPALTRRPPTNG